MADQLMTDHIRFPRERIRYSERQLRNDRYLAYAAFLFLLWMLF